MPVAPGAKLGPYDVVSTLGSGGMGEVWRARDTRLGRDVAIKVLHESVAADVERRARFEREARAVAAISHPHILAIFDIGEHEGQLFVVTELLEGQTLREKLADGPLPFRKVVEIGVQVARGLTAAHDRGIIHRDLKPENLFCTNDGLTKILDFGLARQLAAAAGSGATETVAATDPGTILGTVGYMAPEQVRGQAVDARTDLFALGAVLYEAASGARAFQRDTAADTITAILREDPPDISTSRIDFSPSFDRIVRHCLEKAPEDRFQTARDVAFALSSLSGSASSSSSAVGLAVPPEPRPGRFSGLRMAAGLAIITALAGLAIGRWTAPAPASWRFQPKTQVSQTIFSSRFMPDGETIIISSALAGSTPSLFESRAGQSMPRPFGSAGIHLLSVSSTGELLVLTNARFQAQRRLQGTLARMAVDGTPRALAEDVREADWLPDGSNFIVVRDLGATDVLEFPMGTAVHTVTGYISSPRVSPDGTRVAFMEHPVKYDNRGWVKVVDRAGTVTTLAGEHSAQEGVAWSPDGREVIYSGATGGSEYQMMGVSARGGQPHAWITTAGTAYPQDTRPDGRVLFTREDAKFGVFVRSIAEGTERELTPSDSAWGPSFSTDGKWILMTDGGEVGNDYAVVIRPVDGSPAIRLGAGNARNLSPDGRWAVANLFSTGQCVVYPTGAGAPIILDTRPLERCDAAAFLPDGRYLRVVGNEPGQPTRGYRMDFSKGTPARFELPRGFANILFTSKSGRALGLGQDGRMLLAATDGTVTEARGVLRSDRILRWSDDDRWLFVASPGPNPAVFQVDLATGNRKAVPTATLENRPGLLLSGLADYDPNSGLFLFSSTSRLSTLYLATQR